MTDTIVMPQTVVQTLEIGQQKIAVVKEKSVQVVTAGTQGPQGIQGPPGSPSGLTGSYNISVGGTYGGVFNITVLNGLVRSIGIYGM